MRSEKPPSISVIAGVNGAGKSSVGGAAIRKLGGAYYNPDDAARKIMAANIVLTQSEANSLAWNKGVALLRKVIEEKLHFTFESTLGGTTIPGLLHQAALRGFQIRVWYVGLSSPEL